jgi:hypothetical protein
MLKKLCKAAMGVKLAYELLCDAIRLSEAYTSDDTLLLAEPFPVPTPTPVAPSGCQRGHCGV